MKNPQYKNLINIRDLATNLKLHIETIRRWDSSGLIKSFRKSKRGHRYFSESEVTKILERRNLVDVNQPEWKRFQETDYFVSSDGRVANFRGFLLYQSRRLNKNYYYVEIVVEGKKKKVNVHRLVASAYLENPSSLPQVNHKNGIKTDNRVDNLEWCTASQNMQHAHDLGIGGKPPFKEIIQLTKTGVFLKEWVSIKEAASKIGTRHSNISSVLTGRTKTCLGYKFMYKL